MSENRPYRDAIIHIDFARATIKVRGKPVSLTPREYQTLLSLVKNAGVPMQGNPLLKWHIRHLRRKIEINAEKPRLVVTRRGFGYVYVKPTAGASGRRVKGRS